MIYLINAITFSRIILGILLLVFQFDNLYLLIILAYGSISDTMDGILARKFKVKSDFGGFIDLFADSFFLFSFYFYFYNLGSVGFLLFISILLACIPEFSAQLFYFIKLKKIDNENKKVHNYIHAWYPYLALLGITFNYYVVLLVIVQIVLLIIIGTINLVYNIKTLKVNNK